MSEAHDLLWAARELVASLGDERAQDWLRRFRRLPGVELSPTALKVLRHGQRRGHRRNAELVQQLLQDGYLEKIHNMRRGDAFIQTRLSLRGREALRLRLTSTREVRQ